MAKEIYLTMRISTALSILTILVYSCSSPTETITTIFDNGEVTVRNSIDSISIVYVSGVTPEYNYQMKKDTLVIPELEDLALKGTMTVISDLDGDGIYEFLLKSSGVQGGEEWARESIYKLGGGTFYNVKTVESRVDKTKCSDFVGHYENIEIDSTQEKPLVIVNTRYGTILDGNCDTYAQGTRVTKFDFPSNQQYMRTIDDLCPIKENKIVLSDFYSLPSWSGSLGGKDNFYYSRHRLIRQLENCYEGNEGMDILEDIAGMPFRTYGDEGKRTDLMPYIADEFENVNPKFIQWATTNLIPDPKSKQINEVAFEWFYNYLYKHDFRQFALTRLYIYQSGKERALKQYVDIASTEMIGSQDNNTNRVFYFLEDKTYRVSDFVRGLGLTPGENYDRMNDYGFWMRRMLDGSEGAIWQAVVKVLKLYDNEFYEEYFQGRQWNGFVEIPKAMYDSLEIVADYESVFLRDVPADIASQENGVKVFLENGETKEYVNNQSDGESYAEYYVSGYLPDKKLIFVEYSGYEWGNTYMISVETGETVTFEYNAMPTADGNMIAEDVSSPDYSAINIRTYKDGEWKVSAEAADLYMQSGYWLDQQFFFRTGDKYYIYGPITL